MIDSWYVELIRTRYVYEYLSTIVFVALFSFQLQTTCSRTCRRRRGRHIIPRNPECIQLQIYVQSLIFGSAEVGTCALAALCALLYERRSRNTSAVKTPFRIVGTPWGKKVDLVLTKRAQKSKSALFWRLGCALLACTAICQGGGSTSTLSSAPILKGRCCRNGPLSDRAPRK